jgi:predicted tellurium resistance membrane protein TerC
MVELHDQTRVRGAVRTDPFPVETAGGVQSLRSADLRQLTILHSHDASLLGILIGLLTLSVMEIILGIDNVIFLAIIAGKLPKEQQPRARQLGLGAALGTRILLLLSLSWLLGLTKPLFTLPELPLFDQLEAREISLRDLVLLAGGMFLIGKSVFEVHEKMEHARAAESGKAVPAGAASFGSVLVQIAVIDIVFSLDSVITAVGMVDQVWVMVVAMVIAMFVMLLFAGAISRFVDKHPTIKILALSFLILIGVMLVAEGLGQHMNKGYIYFAMAFAVVIEFVNMRLRKSPTPAKTTG